MAEAFPNSKLLDDEEDDLICGICLEPYDDSNRLPKFLICHHTFCAHCLQVIIQASWCMLSIYRDTLLKYNYINRIMQEAG